MIVTKDSNGALRIPKDIWTKNNGQLTRVKEIWTKNSGSLVQVFGGNVTNYTGNHPYWTYSLNSDFNENDGAVPCWNTFWSTNNAGTYLIGPSNSNRATVQIPLAATTSTFIPGTPGSDGYYIFTTENSAMFANFTAGSDQAITFVGSPPTPIERIGADGITYRWDVLNTGPPNPINTIGNPTRIRAVANNVPGPGAATLTLSRNAVANANSYTAGLTRTYASDYVPPTQATEGYTQYTGFCTFQSNYEIRISQNTSYTITVRCVGGSTNNTTWKIGCLTGTSDGGAQFFSPGSAAFETQAYTTTNGDRSLTFTSPSGATRARPYIRLDYDSGTDGVTGVLPKQFIFEWIRFA